MTEPMRIIAHPNPALKQRAAEVDPATDADLPRLVEVMAATMYEAPGVGLAATQLGIQKRVVVIDVEECLVTLCNPVIEPVGDETTAEEEGCLSLPGITVTVERPAAVTCRALDLTGAPLTIEAEGLLARVVQHETDHLDGVLIIDRASPEERKEALHQYREQLQL